MREAGIGRVLAASLHQGIADLMPSRLEFYEHWLTPDGLRQGTIGLAPLKAVFSFLRQEGNLYRNVMAHAGAHAAEWLLVARRPPFRSVCRRLPSALCTRAALRTARRFIRACYGGNAVAVRVRGGQAALDIHDSVFCSVRDPAASSLCGFYAALTARVLEAYGLPSVVGTAACRATGSPVCQLTVGPRQEAASPAGQSGSEVAP